MLDNPNLAVRLLATHELVKRGGQTLNAMLRTLVMTGSPLQKAHGLWILQRFKGEIDIQLLAAACKDNDVIVRVHAQRILVERANYGPAEHDLVLAGLMDSNPLVQRLAAEALATHPRTDNVLPLLDLLGRVDSQDTHLRHAVRMALRDQLRVAVVWNKLEMTKLPAKYQQAIADVCPGVHAEQAGKFLISYLDALRSARDDVQRYIHTIVRYAEPNAASQVTKFIVGRFPGDLATQAAMLKTVQQASQERGQPPGESVTRLAGALVSVLLKRPPPRISKAALISQGRSSFRRLSLNCWPWLGARRPRNNCARMRLQLLSPSTL